MYVGSLQEVNLVMRKQGSSFYRHPLSLVFTSLWCVYKHWCAATQLSNFLSYPSHALILVHFLTSEVFKGIIIEYKLILNYSIFMLIHYMVFIMCLIMKVL